MKAFTDFLIRLVIFLVVAVSIYLLVQLGTWANSLFNQKTAWYWTFYHWMGIVAGIIGGLLSAVLTDLPKGKK